MVFNNICLGNTKICIKVKTHKRKKIYIETFVSLGLSKQHQLEGTSILNLILTGCIVGSV